MIYTGKEKRERYINRGRKERKKNKQTGKQKGRKVFR